MNFLEIYDEKSDVADIQFITFSRAFQNEEDRKMPKITFFDRSDGFLIPFLILLVIGTAFVYPLLPNSVAIQFNPATSEATSMVHKSFGIWD